jgi:hypothetical protein
VVEVSWYGGAFSLRHAAAGLGDNDKCSFELAPNVPPFHDVTFGRPLIYFCGTSWHSLIRETVFIR